LFFFFRCGSRKGDDLFFSQNENGIFKEPVKLGEEINSPYSESEPCISPSERAAETIISAMGFLQYTDAIIIDLRNNTGGNPEIVAFIGGYFFTEEYQTEFGSLFHRIKNKTFQYKTPLYLPGKRLVHTDLYILVGPNTFSAAEGFAYDLQHYGRAIIVGTKTKGGAHAANPFIINDYFVVDLPFAKPILLQNQIGKVQE